MTKNAVVANEASGPPAALAERLAADAGKGVSGEQEDNIVPLIYILQTQSPQVSKRNPEYIEGAEPADIWLRNAAKPIVKGNDGFLFQPCHFTKDWVEWVPRTKGGGFVARHDDCPEDAVLTEDSENPNRKRYVRKNGNEVKETRYHVGFVLTENGAALPYVIPLTSSGHTVSRTWMTMMNAKQISGQVAPSWASLYRLTTRERINPAGTWFTFEVRDCGWVATVEDYERGAKLHQAFVEGQKVMDAPDEQQAALDPDQEAM